jgi:PAS domain S-box-containing protein
VATSEGIPVDSTDLSGDDFPWTTDQTRRGRVVRFSQLDELPPEAAVDRQSGLAIGTRSLIAIPLVGEGGVTCVLALSTLRRERVWPDDLVQRLELLGSIFAGALARSRAGTAVEESEERFRLAADAAPVMMWMSGPDAGCTYFNRSWLEFTGRRPEEELGDGWADGVHAEDRAECQERYRQAFNAQDAFTLEYRLRRFDGQYRWLLDHGVPRFSRGGFNGYIGTCIDVTEIRASQLEARLQREELAHAQRVATMGEMAASLAHEINQPLAAIVANAQAAQRLARLERPCGEDLHDALADIASDARRAAHVIRRVRALFTKDHSERQPLSINELITEVTGLLAGDIKRHGIALHTRLGSALPPVPGDSIQLQQVLLNLVLNACQAMTEVEAGLRELTIESAEREPGLLEIRVRDTGPGVKDLELERIFEPFVSTKSEGLGMGLSISRSIVAAHGGRIWATRNPDTGLTVHVDLPT